MIFSNYKSALEYLYSALPVFHRIGAPAYKRDLINTIRLCEVLGNPQKKFKSIHVAGTNGKGSSSHMLAAILQSAGYSTGLYTSPHLKEFTERVRVGGAEMDPDFVVDFVNRMKPTLDEVKPSFFEMSVAMAFDYFAIRKVDVSVVEVGLGGRLDSTNIIMPELSLITNISFDHKDLLGDTLQKIAFEKAGIIKKDIPVVVSERQPEVEDVFITRADQLGAELYFASDMIQLRQESGGFDVYQGGGVWLEAMLPELKGAYQQNNIKGVLAAVLQLRERGFDVTDGAVIKGIANTVSLTGLKGRWQKLSDNPLIICDTAHNAAGIMEVVKQIRAQRYNKLHIVLGVVKDKDLSGILQLLPKEATYYFCQARIPRALDAPSLAEAAEAAGLSGRVIPDVNEAIETARRNSSQGDMIFVGGSTFVVAEIEGL